MLRGAKLNQKPKATKRKPKSKRNSVPCPSCQHPFTTVDRTYPTEATVLRRTRRCAECDRTFSTKEIATSIDDLATGVAALAKLLDSHGHSQKFLKQSHERADAP